ncbi:hypothetical protein OVA13_02695 [Pseudoxanthomonas sp. SL93]|uniref:hypothetical protein n=1 Tax=Pseudoxanthomonas sp. SL93 TaxID=2995142 RepID=UPI002271DFAF|nr:hypothetical protein [Pseudoxanthomonas sp. SL93]WAC63718.1 hypothetical protein OVA13_02695 [Pseudoxanthomonas sp. SL93]
MHVDLALFEGDTLLDRGCFTVGADRAVFAFSLFQASHQLVSGSADVVLFGFPKHIDLKKIALDMPVHESLDWETIDLGRYTVAFSCRLEA